jgi:hypothetical protein
MSSFVTAHRRGCGLYWADDGDNTLSDDEVVVKHNAIMKRKVKQFQLNVPDGSMLQAIQGLVTSNLQETSQVNFAALNRKDSEKTATEINAASQSAQALSTVQVVLFSSALRAMYQFMFNITRSRIVSGIIVVDEQIKQMYGIPWMVKPSGDVDVIERQQLVQSMMTAWPVMQNTPAASAFLSDLIAAMFPETAQKYIQIFQQAQVQQQSAQAQQQQQMMAQAQQMASSIVQLSKHPEMFSDIGKVNALPKLQEAAGAIEQMGKQSQQQGAQH